MKRLILLLCAAVPAIMAQDPKTNGNVSTFAVDWRVTGFVRQGGRAQASMEGTGGRARFVREGDRLPGDILVAQVDYGNRSVTLAKGNETVVLQPEKTTAPIVRMSKAGINDDVLIRTIQSTRSSLHLTAQDVESLKRDGVSDRVVVAMLDTNQAVPASAKPSEPPVSAARETSGSDHVSRPSGPQVVQAVPAAAPVYYTGPVYYNTAPTYYNTTPPPTIYYPDYGAYDYPVRYYGFSVISGRRGPPGWNRPGPPSLGGRADPGWPQRGGWNRSVLSHGPANHNVLSHAPLSYSVLPRGSGGRRGR